FLPLLKAKNVVVDPVKRKIVISRDVFEENKSWDWNKNGNGKNSQASDDEIEEEINEPVTVNTEENNNGIDNPKNNQQLDEDMNTSSGEEVNDANQLTP
ncbi:hypothetical protein A2U01_0073766, partial [Trifolium medium]|nr:hypothetical protein [Trifolium medium]